MMFTVVKENMTFDVESPVWVNDVIRPRTFHKSRSYSTKKIAPCYTTIDNGVAHFTLSIENCDKSTFDWFDFLSQIPITGVNQKTKNVFTVEIAVYNAFCDKYTKPVFGVVDLGREFINGRFVMLQRVTLLGGAK